MPTSVLVEKFGDGYILRYVQPGANGVPTPVPEGAHVTRKLGEEYDYPTNRQESVLSFLREMLAPKAIPPPPQTESPPPETETP